MLSMENVQLMKKSVSKFKIRKFAISEEKNKKISKIKDKKGVGQTVWSLTLLQAYPSYSRNKHREHGASLLVSRQSESEPVGI